MVDSIDRATYDQLRSQFGNAQAKKIAGPSTIAPGPDSATQRALKPKKKGWFRKSSVSAFGVEHGETFAKGARKDALEEAWKLGGVTRKLGRKDGKQAAKAFRALPTSPDVKAAFEVSRNRVPIAATAGGVGAAGGVGLVVRHRARHA